jgi:hypothetical protein
MSFLDILVFVSKHIRQLGDICVTAPNRRPAAIAKIAVQIEYAYRGEVKDDSAESGEADHRSSSVSQKKWPRAGKRRGQSRNL